MNKAKWFKGFDGYNNFYTLGGEIGKHSACVSVNCNSFYKYNVSFAYYAVADNLKKSRNFRTLAEAKKYALEVVNA